MKHNDTGKLGEDIAKQYLAKKGYKIIERNWRTRYNEIDLVVENKEWCVIVEVRTKIGERFGTPEETLDYNKTQKLLRNAKAYAAMKRVKKPYRIDAVCVVLNIDDTLSRITHYENVAN
ncbi:MAG: YraN family protein [Candidatus Wildermuthbacteria bacterium]|nr:YraN family protein [Candidatus Wildermuthbacteria bacterium]